VWVAEIVDHMYNDKLGHTGLEELTVTGDTPEITAEWVDFDMNDCV